MQAGQVIDILVTSVQILLAQILLVLKSKANFAKGNLIP